MAVDMVVMEEMMAEEAEDTVVILDITVCFQHLVIILK